ncbi:hypothetical protein ABID82_001696 [Methylobacterium sp. PvP062]|jgi:hypothetical protein|uniref:Uncharacterized protein n=2 Tax=Methylobacterium TaxID=407 RepID=A0A509EHN6_9HYPH|nr:MULTISPECIES: hypothetical protein [Methylobacterium]MCX7333281.1 hypothetical protein [Hyphomicrobiales bacterium]GAN46004.1 hypothetical protein ME121_0007 [Methylobacterium sp. ME121]MBN6818479.1 hypothetical protein [Methylobacterium organophilum]MBP2492900.1 hypothetical protein [Methylobacterium sp. PvP105]MBP2500728.1 hypothetical protein [Methylobacterium sp. PvP109]
MARRKQSSSGFNLDGFDGVDLALDLGEAIDRWRDEFVRTVGMTDPNRGMAKYRRAAGWAVDEVARQAVLNIRYRFHSTMKRRSPWTESAVAYKRLSKAELNALERGERSPEDVYAHFFVKAKQSVYLKYLFGMEPNIRLPGDVGLARNRILIPWWDNITKTQGVRPTKDGGVPRAFLSRLAREVSADRSPKRSGTQGRWGVYYGAIKIHGQAHEGYIARPPRVPVTEQDVLHRGHSALDQVIQTRGGDLRRIGRKLKDVDHPRVLFLAVDKALYKPILQKPWDEACSDAASRVPEIMSQQLNDNLAHMMKKGTYLR